VQEPVEVGERSPDRRPAAPRPAVGGQGPDRVGDLLRVDHEPVLERVVVRDARDFGAGHAGHRSVQIVERLLGDDGRDLRAIPTELVVLVHDQELAGLADRFEEGVAIEWPERPNIDHLHADPVFGDAVGGLEGVVGHQSVGHDRDLGSGVGHGCTPEGYDVVRVGILTTDAPVHLLVLEEQDRIVVADRRSKQTAGVVGGGRHDDLQTRDVGEERLDAL
jgi:hypothetical protein